MEILQGSLEPALALTLTDNDKPMNLTNAVSVELVAELHGEQLFRRVVPAPYPSTGELLPVPWQAGDTATPGRIWLDVLVTWPGGRPQWVSGGVVDVL